jgi:CheY-like chemotaxis protein
MKQILLVDDNEAFLRPMEWTLRQAGYEVQTAGDGAAALKRFFLHAFDLVITDLVMPDKEGIETIIELRRLDPALKIIAMSGDTRMDPGDYLPMARLLGAAATLTKPFTAEEILALVAGLRGEPACAEAPPAEPCPEPNARVAGLTGSALDDEGSE